MEIGIFIFILQKREMVRMRNPATKSRRDVGVLNPFATKAGVETGYTPFAVTTDRPETADYKTVRRVVAIRTGLCAEGVAVDRESDCRKARLFLARGWGVAIHIPWLVIPRMKTLITSNKNVAILSTPRDHENEISMPQIYMNCAVRVLYGWLRVLNICV